MVLWIIRTRAAGIRFAEGCYKNELAYTLQEKGSLQFGLKSASGGNNNWCCFDNFSLLYQPLPDYYDGIGEVKSESVENVKSDDNVYDLSGRKHNAQTKNGLVIRNGKKILY